MLLRELGHLSVGSGERVWLWEPGGSSFFSLFPKRKTNYGLFSLCNLGLACLQQSKHPRFMFDAPLDRKMAMDYLLVFRYGKSNAALYEV